MAVLGVRAADAEQLIAERPAGWSSRSSTADSSVVVSGDRDAIATIVAAAEQQGLFAREIAVDFPAHTSALEPLHADAARPAAPRSNSPTPPCNSSARPPATWWRPDTDFADYWYRNLRNTVRFDRAAATALRRGARTFVELSAHPALLFALGDLVGRRRR